MASKKEKLSQLTRGFKIIIPQHQSGLTQRQTN